MAGALDVVIKLVAEGADDVRGAMGTVSRAVNGMTDDIEAAQMETRRLRDELEQAESSGASLSDIADRAQDLEDHLNSAGGRAGQLQERLSSIRNVSAGMAAAGAVGLTIFNGLAEMGADVEESENLVKESFGDSLEAAEKWSQGLQDSLGMTATEVRRNAATFNVMFESMKIAKGEAFSMSKGLTELAYDMASFYNLSPDEAFEKLRAGITGEAEPLKALGVLLNETTVNAFAFSHGIAKTGDTLTEQQKVQARYGLILEQTTKAQGDMARTLDSSANSARRAEAAFERSQATLGQGAANAKKHVDSLLGSLYSIGDASPGILEGAGYLGYLGSMALTAGGTVLGLASQVGLLALGFPTLGASAAAAWASVTGGAVAAYAAISALLLPIALVTVAIAGLWVAWKGSQDAGTMSDADLKKKWGPLGDFWVSASGSDQDTGPTAEDRASYEAAKKVGLTKGKTFEQWRGVSVDPASTETEVDPVAEAKAKADKAMKDASASISGAQQAGGPLPPTSASVAAQQTAPSVTAVTAKSKKPDTSEADKARDKYLQDAIEKAPVVAKNGVGEKLLDLMFSGFGDGGKADKSTRKSVSKNDTARDQTEHEPSISDAFSWLRRGGSIFDLDKANAKGAASTSKPVSRETQSLNVPVKSQVSTDAMGDYVIHFTADPVRIPNDFRRALGGR